MKSIDIAASKGLSIGGVDIITDSSGTTTLKNIDALDATTEATIEAAIDTLSTLTGPMVLNNGSESGGTALAIGNRDIDQIVLDIDADNTTVDVVNITADAVTTANVIDISCDALTTGSALKIEDDSPQAGLAATRNVVDIYQKNAAAVNATALQVKSDGGQVGVLIDKNMSGLSGYSAWGLHVDLDRTVPGSGTQAHNDVGINLDVTSASLGTSTLKGMDIDVVGAASGTSTATGLDINVSGADSSYGIKVVQDKGVGGAFTNTETSSATTGGRVSLISNDGAALGDDHRLGGVHFGAFDGSDIITGAKIQAIADAAWSTSENGTRLEFYTMDGDDTSELSLTLDSDLLATFAGNVALNTVTSGTWEGTAIASAYMASATDSAKGAVELATTAESDTGTDTARAVTPAGLKSHIDARHSISYLHFSGQGTMLSSGNWVGPSASGINHHTWNLDFGVNTETNDSTAASFAKQYQHNGIRLPNACIIDGFTAMSRNASANNQVTVGLFLGRAADSNLPDWGTTNAIAPKLQCHADMNNEGGTYTNRPVHAEVAGAGLVMNAGDVIWPAIKLTGVTSGGGTNNVYTSITIAIKTRLA